MEFGLNVVCIFLFFSSQFFFFCSFIFFRTISDYSIKYILCHLKALLSFNKKFNNKDQSFVSVFSAQ